MQALLAGRGPHRCGGHISTDEVFGYLGETGRFCETTPYDPRSPYSASSGQCSPIAATTTAPGNAPSS